MSEQELGQLVPDQRAQARLINELTRTGEITFISRIDDGETRIYEIEVTFPKSDRAMRAGKTADSAVLRDDRWVAVTARRAQPAQMTGPIG